MSIRNMDSYMRNLWDWGMLRGCFGSSKAAVSDIDGIIERRGRFLVIEAKSEGKAVPMGQSIMFSALAKIDQFTVVVVWGKPGHVVKMQEWPAAAVAADNAGFRKLVSNWYRRANSKSGFTS